MRIIVEGLQGEGKAHVSAEIVAHLRHCGYTVSAPGNPHPYKVQVPHIRVIETNEPIGAPICGEDGQ